jgi:aminobenzoyl-glutamate utilization protein B
MYENIKKVGLPQWSEDDQKLAKALQKELKVPERGLNTRVREMRAPRQATTDGDFGGEGGQQNQPTGGGSDDIGDVSWNVPTVTLRYPSNIQAGRDTTGPTRFRWRRRSRTRV